LAKSQSKGNVFEEYERLFSHPWFRRIWIDGTFTDPDTTFTPGVTAKQNLAPPIYTAKLRLVTLAFVLQVKELQTWQDSPKSKTLRTGIRKSVDAGSSHPVSWSVYFYARDLNAQKVAQGHLQVLVVAQSIGLVVRTCAKSTERISVVELSRECGRFWPCDQHSSQYLPDFYTFSLRTTYIT
jgi:hypothetical protein